MSITILGSESKTLDSIIKGLETYEKDHPDARIDLYSHNSISVRVRVIDPAFAGMAKSHRHATIWNYLGGVPEEDQCDISMLVLLAPEEQERSMANLEFEDPSPSLIE